MCNELCKREMLIRGGMTTIMVATLYFALDIDPMIWLLPLAVVALVWIKWRVAGRDKDADSPEAE